MSDMDSQRLEELFRYFQATSDAVTSEYYDIDSPLGYQPEHACISSDPVLNALTQLGACRMNADRAFVSLIDHEHQFVVAEMTTSISMFDSSHHGENHGVCIGVRSLELHAGICAGTMPAFTSGFAEDRPYLNTSNVFANSSRYVINDLSLEDRYAERPYVTGYPQMRYYAEVPITSPSGFVLGTYAVLDNKPRCGLTDEHYRILHETSMAIMQHLEMIKLREEHNHAVRLLQGLSSFIQDRPGSSKMAKPQNRPTKITEMNTVNHGGYIGTVGNSDVSSVPDPPAVPQVSETSKLAESRRGNSVTSNSQQSPASVKSTDIVLVRDLNKETATSTIVQYVENSVSSTSLAQKNAPELPDAPISDDFRVSDMTESSGELFTHAADLLRDAMKLEGVVFLDPTPSSFTIHATAHTEANNDSSNPTSDTHVSQSALEDDSVSPAVMKPPRWVRSTSHTLQPKSSKNFGHSIKNSDHTISLPEKAHQELLRLCSKGQVFNITRSPCKPSSSSSTPSSTPDSSDLKSNLQSDYHDIQLDRGLDRIQKIEKIIRQHLPEARSIMFVPLWNPHTGKWFAGGLGWSTQHKRILTSSDLSYFATFGNSLIAEVARLELLATDRAKSDFISCMSHELRSPLHGILGSTELLLDSVTDNDQWQYVSMIGKCGRILLETMENILQFSKINRGAPGTRLADEQVQNGILPSGTVVRVSGAQSDLDLSALVEETCEVLVAGTSDVAQSSTPNYLRSHDPKPLSESSDPGRNLLSDSSKTVILRINPRCSEVITSSPAAWRRCLLNLLGNSLKYTMAGHVQVELRYVTTTTDSTPGASRPTMVLIVRDTGRGIGKQYLESQLFRPFEQESAFSSGTGLGLSIVKSLVDDLGGTVEIQSEIGVGTEVTLSIPVSSAHDTQELEWKSHSYTGLEICLLGFDTEHASKSLPPKLSHMFAKRAMIMETSLTMHCEQWLGMTCFRTDKIADVRSDIIAIFESNLHLLQKHLDPKIVVVPANCALLVICSDHHTHYHSHDHEYKGRVTFISQPFGPRKLATVVESFRRLKDANDSKFQHEISINSARLLAKPDRGRSDIKSTTSVALVSSSPTRQAQSKNATHDRNGSVALQDPLQFQVNQPKHLLLVDDNSINLKLIVQFVKKMSCTYEIATNGLEAFEIYKSTSKHFDFVFMDLSMPIMDGFESTRAIRAFEDKEGRRHTQVIAMTGLGSKDARNKAESSGISMFWTKPVKLQVIKALIEADDTEGFNRKT